MTKRKKQISDTIRDAIIGSGKSLYRIGEQSGVAYAPLHGFVNRDRSLSMENLDRLADYLGLVLIVREEAETKRGPIRRGAGKLFLLGVLATGVQANAAIQDAHAALVSVGHTEAEAQRLLDKAIATGHAFNSASDLLKVIYSSRHG